MVGQTLDPDGAIADVAGEGRPRVGKIERRGDELWLLGDDGWTGPLAGALAHPRIAGPGYRVWVLGVIDPNGRLHARRIGVLARP